MPKIGNVCLVLQRKYFLVLPLLRTGSLETDTHTKPRGVVHCEKSRILLCRSQPGQQLPLPKSIPGKQDIINQGVIRSQCVLTLLKMWRRDRGVSEIADAFSVAKRTAAERRSSTQGARSRTVSSKHGDKS